MTQTEQPLARGGALDVLRFAAAAFITLYHFGSEDAPRALAEIHPIFARGFLATDFFLMLSGYVLARMYGGRITGGRTGVGGFLARRLARLWPSHLIVLGAYVAVFAVAALAGVSINNAEGFAWDRLGPQALLIHAWGVAEPGWNTATWTLSALVVCYAAFPWLWRLLARLTPSTALLAAVAFLAAADLACRAWMGVEVFTVEPKFGVLRGLPLFTLGAAVARFGLGAPLTRPQAWALGLCAAAVLVASQVAGVTFVSMLAIAAVILAAGARAPRHPSKLVARAAGLSFALFLTHNFIALLWFKATSLALGQGGLPTMAAWGLWAAAFPLSLAGAAAFDRFVDRPVQDWVKQRMQPGGRAVLKPA